MQLLFTADSTVRAISLDFVNDRVFVAATEGGGANIGTIYSIRSNGSDPREIVTNIRNGPVGIAVDAEGNRVYWARNGDGPNTGRIDSCDLEGGDHRIFLSDRDFNTLAFDAEHQRLYWITLDNTPMTAGLGRTNIDGSGSQVIPIGNLLVRGIAVMPTELLPCLGDLNDDRMVNLPDLAHLLGHFGLLGANPEDGDLDGDGDVDVADLACLLGRYGALCP